VSATQKRLPLTPRQADALAKWLPFLFHGLAVTDPDELAALREVAGKLDTLREQ
jgi:uncharacterized protein YgfB (UPF0149 family)